MISVVLFKISLVGLFYFSRYFVPKISVEIRAEIMRDWDHHAYASTVCPYF